MANVLLIKGWSQYNAMRNYIDEIEIGFRMAGYDTYVLDAREKTGKFQYDVLLGRIKFDIIFACNAIVPKSYENTYYITYLTDHPAFHRSRLESLNKKAIVFVCDRRHEAYVRRYYPNIKYVKYIPLAGIASKQYVPYSKRSRDIVFTGSYRNPESSYSDIFDCEKALHEIAKYMAEDIVKNPEQDLEMCLRNCLNLFEMEMFEQKFHEWMN